MKKPLGFDDLVARLRAVAGALPDPRTGDNTRYAMADIALAAFSVFFTQCPSFLSFQQNMELARARNNARSLFQVQRIPTDNHLRQTLDPVAPEPLMALFDDLHRAFDELGVLPAMRAVQNTRLIALDATRHFSSPSKNIHCPKCSCIQHADGKVTHFHSAITPVIVSPGHAQVVPLRPEFITPQDGHAKQDCEIAAAKRWLAAHTTRYHTGNDTLLGDDLYAHQLFCRQVLLHGFHFLFTCKPASHPHLSQWVAALVPGRDLHTLTLRTKGKSKRREQHVLSLGPRGAADRQRRRLEGQLVRHDGDQRRRKILYHNARITDWKITADHVAGLVSAGRARWKIENENNNVLRIKVGARRTTYLHFENWTRLMDFMRRGLEIGPHAIAKS